jgi:hypothetical protein
MPAGPNFVLKLREPTWDVCAAGGVSWRYGCFSFTQREIAVIVEAETLAHARRGGEPDLPSITVR